MGKTGGVQKEKGREKITIKMFEKALSKHNHLYLPKITFNII